MAKSDNSRSDRVKDGGAPRVWATGFSESFRSWFVNELPEVVTVRTSAFRTGEEVMVELSAALSEKAPPDHIILDLRLPIINGVNVAIAARAFELGFSREERIPFTFLFNPPDSTSFEKVVKFCQPVKLIRPGPDQESLQSAAIKVVSGIHS